MSCLENKPTVLECAIAKAFADAQLNVTSLEELCCNLNDAEAREETGAFLNMRWQDVDAARWMDHYGALYFFTDHAFRYFLPSLMVRALHSLDVVHLAVQTIIWSLLACGDRRLGNWNRGRWVALTVDELNTVNAWLIYLRKPLAAYGFTAECEAAIAEVQQMLGPEPKPETGL